MNKIEDVITYGYKFDMGKYMSIGWKNFKQEAGSYIGFTILYFVIIFAIALIPFANLLSSAIQYTLIAGIFIFTRNMLNGRETFGDFFSGFNSFGQIILFWLVLVLFMMPAIVIFVIYLIPAGVVPELITGNPDMDYIGELVEDMLSERMGSIIYLYIFLMLYIIYLYISYSFTLVFIVDRGLSFWDAMEASRKVIAKNFFSFLGMYIVLALLITFGTIVTCGLGILVLIPYLYNVIFAAYDDIVGPEEDIADQNQNLEDFGSSHTE